MDIRVQAGDTHVSAHMVAQIPIPVFLTLRHAPILHLFLVFSAQLLLRQSLEYSYPLLGLLSF